MGSILSQIRGAKYERVIDSILLELNAVPDDYTDSILWNGGWWPQDALCLELCFYAKKLVRDGRHYVWQQ